MTSTDTILILALGLAAFVLFRLHQAGILGPQPGQASPDPAAAPPGTSFVALGQYAVAPDKQWLLIKPGS